MVKGVVSFKISSLLQLDFNQDHLMQPLRSTASTAASSLLRVAPSHRLASLLSYSRFQSFVFLPWHQGDWFPQCPIKGCIRLTPPIRRTDRKSTRLNSSHQ